MRKKPIFNNIFRGSYAKIQLKLQNRSQSNQVNPWNEVMLSRNRKFNTIALTQIQTFKPLL
jgi:hypothetical protein